MKLSDNEVDDRLHAAREALGDDEADTAHGNAAIAAARKVLEMFRLALFKASNRQP